MYKGKKRPYHFGLYVRENGFYCLYLVAVEGHAAIKVGIADDARSRFGAIQTHNFLELRLHRFWWVAGRPVAARVETSFKKHFREKRIRGEWFDLDLEEAEAFIQGEMKEAGAWAVSEEEMIAFMQANPHKEFRGIFF